MLVLVILVYGNWPFKFEHQYIGQKIRRFISQMMSIITFVISLKILFNLIYLYLYFSHQLFRTLSYLFVQYALSKYFNLYGMVILQMWQYLTSQRERERIRKRKIWERSIIEESFKFLSAFHCFQMLQLLLAVSMSVSQFASSNCLCYCGSIIICRRIKIDAEQFCIIIKGY